jgi:hypothetical protein
MFGIESLTGSAYSAAIVGLVLGEAMVLYVGYGGLTRAVGTRITDAIGDS